MTRINTNVESLIARRNLNANYSAMDTALQRLSTGLRINTGKDDPAGLIASETLRSRMTAITQAIDNATRADTVVNIAEGGLQEISSLLLEIEGLIDRTANEAGLTEDEIAANQLQIDAILQSIDRLANATAFGDKKLLNGTLDFNTSGININEPTGASVSHLEKVKINAAKIPTTSGAYRQVTVNVVTGSDFAFISAAGTGTDGTGVADGTISNTLTIQVRGKHGSEILSFASGTSHAEIATAINASKDLTGVSAVVSGAGTAASPSNLIMSSTEYGSNAFVSVAILENAAAFSMPGGTDVIDYGTDGTITVNGTNATVSGLDVSVRSNSLSVDLVLDASFGSTNGGSTSFEITGGGALFSISPDVGLAGMETIGIQEVSTGQLGHSGVGYISSLGSGLTNSLASRNYTTAQRIVREAISQVASLRGRVGAFQKNTLSTTINSLSVARENVTAAESAIRDADFASETSNLTRAQILVNSSTAVLQIANTKPQNVLALLGG
ncbi:MAG TPA: flagellin [Phycisphaerae bacterium]|nr:flagellin [Phycisphaerae bacterium]HNU45789.1 flagellin [Phycisphaerae bacterium]